MIQGTLILMLWAAGWLWLCVIMHRLCKKDGDSRALFLSLCILLTVYWVPLTLIFIVMVAIHYITHIVRWLLAPVGSSKKPSILRSVWGWVKRIDPVVAIFTLGLLLFCAGIVGLCVCKQNGLESSIEAARCLISVLVGGLTISGVVIFCD